MNLATTAPELVLVLRPGSGCPVARLPDRSALPPAAPPRAELPRVLRRQPLLPPALRAAPPPASFAPLAAPPPLPSAPWLGLRAGVPADRRPEPPPCADREESRGLKKKKIRSNPEVSPFRKIYSLSLRSSFLLAPVVYG
ncbi:classical arabinogalactan protein 9-like [Setaria italica]|uniref:classical arabinogalactan protein 9-like n=1 Tax=Setaria italica TaxID=4555 RepID=UPI000BE5E7B2|nr:classical arabinogalactan protein 9-like [Setaria italica]